MDDSQEVLFTGRGLTKTYGSTVALDGIDLDISRGEIVGLVGPNGAGKSTLMGLLGGAIHATSGTMMLAGEIYAPEYREAALAAGVSAIPQQFRADPDITVAEEIFRTTFNNSLATDSKREYARELISSDGLQLDVAAPMGSIARAEQLYVALLRLTFEESHLVLLDEITATSNDLEISILHSITNRLTTHSRSVVYISHRLDEVQSLSDRIVILRDGRIHRELYPSESGGRSGIAFHIFDRHIESPERPTGTPASAEPLLQVANLTNEKFADVSLQVFPGEVLGVTGMRHSGHSALAATIGGARTFDSGTFQLRGQDIRFSSTEEAIHHDVAYLSDEDDERGVDDGTHIADAVTVHEIDESSFAAEAKHLRGVIHVLEQLSISSRSLHAPIGDLSIGDQQKVILARWLQSGADIVVLNHPTRGVDAASRVAVYDMMNEITARGGSVILVSSDMSELVEQANRVAVMRDGQLVDVFQNADVTEDSLVMIALGSEWETQQPRSGRRALNA